MKLRTILTLAILLLPSLALAHKSSDSYLKIETSNNKTTLQWDIALTDLNRLLGLDADNNGKVTWGEVKTRHSEITTIAQNALIIKNDNQTCTLGAPQHRINYHSGYAYAVLQSEVNCSLPITRLSIDYNLLFQQDVQHRGLLSIKSGEQGASFVFSPEQRSYQFKPDARNSSEFLSFFIKGVEHLIGGIDHLLFLFVLLLPAAMGAYNKRLRFTLIETIKILTAFTIAHAITLTLSVLKLVQFPVTPVEIIIAISVAIAAADNIKPFLGKHRWVIAGGFGLIHGLGFANALGPLDLTPNALFTALLAFNLGLEAAQIAIASLIIPLGYILQQHRMQIARISATAGSAMAFSIAILWTIDRSLGFEMMPF